MPSIGDDGAVQGTSQKSTSFVAKQISLSLSTRDPNPPKQQPHEKVAMEPESTPQLSLKISRSNSSSCCQSGRAEEKEGDQVKEEPVSPAGLVFRQEHTNCYIIAILGFGKPLDVAIIKAGLEATLARHPRFSSVQVSNDDREGTTLRWKPTKVDVDDHVVVPDLHPESSSSDTASPDQLVEDYVASLTTVPMNSSRPLWELHLLNIPTSEAAAVAVFRIHHSLGDGASLISLLLACTRRTADPASLPTLPESRPPPPPPPTSASPLALLLYIWTVLVVSWNTLVDFVVLVATSIWLKDTPTALKGGEGVEFRSKRVVHRTVSLDDVKDIKNSMHCTVNDVLVGVTSAGISRYLHRRHGETNDGKKQQLLKASTRLRSAMIINMRPKLEIHDLAEMMAGKNCGVKWGNLISYVILPFPIAMYEDPLDYVRKGKAAVDRKKNSLQAVLAYRCATFLIKMFGVKGGAAMTYGLISNTTFSYSNVVGPVDEISFYGHPILYLAPSVYGHPHALTLHYQSYMNTMKIVVAVDESTIPYPHQLLDDLAESLKVIKEAIPTKKS
ncbi:wax ester synthase/diacylglycerol acyltransferase 11-like isoform X1 [Musa acuminata AAA Group]|uniref:wax ester synthase/diacylglycerol acyltransferase 11-like isoform X1 n=1 Tax=Musa acuminata AAA Group TaxID=214697 RepID=UPI0031E056CD